MDPQNFRSLQEAYLEVVENQQLDEGYVEFDKDRGPRKPSPRGKLVTKSSQKRLGNILAPHHRDAKKQGERIEKMKSVRDTHSPEKVQSKAAANKERGESKKRAFGNRLRRSDGQGIRDSYDYYDIILSHLLDEGYAETPEEAEAIMVNMSEGLRVLPREKMQSKAASKRRKALGSALKSKFTTGKGTTERNVVDAKNKKLRSQADKMDQVAGDYTPSGSRNKEAKNRGGSSNPRNRMGSDEYVNRNIAKNRAMLGMGEQVDLYDIILSHLLDEGYAETPEAAEVIMVNMSEEWRNSIIECD